MATPNTPRNQEEKIFSSEFNLTAGVNFDVAADPLDGNFNFEDWDPIATDAPLPGMMILPESNADLPTSKAHLEEDSSTAGPSFLQDGTNMGFGILRPGTSLYDPGPLQNFIRGIEETLQSWVRNGFNGFIHRQLYEKGMPACLQDTFTALAAYANRTPAVKETILQIAGERSLGLTCRNMSTANGAQGVTPHLACVLALFIYEVKGLFDGAVRPRASAEKHLPTLRQRAAQLWQASCTV